MKQDIATISRIAQDVYRSLGSGFSEDVYDRAIQVGLRLAGIRYENQKVVELKYRDHYVGEGYPDLLVHLGKMKVVVELKAVASELGACEEQQLRNYMKILSVEHGLLINFQMPGRKQGKTQLETREIVNKTQRTPRLAKKRTTRTKKKIRKQTRKVPLRVPQYEAALAEEHPELQRDNQEAANGASSALEPANGEIVNSD